MESFEQVCRVALQAAGYVVTGNVKVMVRRRTRKAVREESQEHGYEIDLVGARAGKLVLAEVKSFFGSRGVNRQSFRGTADPDLKPDFDGYKLFNDDELRRAVLDGACDRYGYSAEQVEMRLYVGRFARALRAGGRLSP